MVLDIDHSKRETPRNRLLQRSHSTKKQAAICSQIDSLLALRVIEVSRALYWSHTRRMVHDQTPLDPASRTYTALSAACGLYHWTRVTMGLKGPVSYFRRSMSNTVMTDLVYHICELYIDEVLIHGVILPPSSREKVKYVGHVVSSTPKGPEFSRPQIQKALYNYFRYHIKAVAHYNGPQRASKPSSAAKKHLQLPGTLLP